MYTLYSRSGNATSWLKYALPHLMGIHPNSPKCGHTSLRRICSDSPYGVCLREKFIVPAIVYTGWAYAHTLRLIDLCTFRDIHWNHFTSSCTVGGCNAYRVLLIVGQSEGGHCLESSGGGEKDCLRTHQSDSVIGDRSPSIILWVAQLNYNRNVLRTILNSGGGTPSKRWQTWRNVGI